MTTDGNRKLVELEVFVYSFWVFYLMKGIPVPVRFRYST
jgi:hypothetical protein